MEFKLPDIGEGVHEGEVVRWLVKPGDTISVDQPIIEVMTDKATVEIPSPHAGKVEKLHAKEGEIIKVGQVIISLEASAGAKAAAPAKSAAASNTGGNGSSQKPVMQASQQTPQQQTSRPAASVTASAPTGSVAEYKAEAGNILASPSTRRLAREMNVDIARIQGSGPHGRVMRDDVQKFSGATAAGPQLPAYTPTRKALQIPQGENAETLIPLRGIRRKISEAMTKSRFTIPDFTYVDECDVTELVAFRKEAKPLAEKQGVKLTFMPFICKAVIQGLKEFPYMNAVLDEQSGNIVLKHYYNIGVAVDTDDGLVVPVIKNADQKSILDLAHEMQVLAEKARTKKLSLDDLQGGTFTISNAGNIGGMLATPIINWPEVAIFGVHKISKRPVVKNDQITIADVIWLSVAVDHRVVDGALAARFMNVVMDYLASPKKMMLGMA